jgi:hypothetical protein
MSIPLWVDKNATLTDLARRSICPRCRARVLEALVDCWRTLLDPVQLDGLAELAELMVGGATYEVWRSTGSRWRVNRRDLFILQDNPLDRKRPVVAEHRCFPARVGERLPEKPAGPVYNPDHPPF